MLTHWRALLNQMSQLPSVSGKSFGISRHRRTWTRRGHAWGHGVTLGLVLLLALPAPGQAQERPPADPWGPSTLEVPKHPRAPLWETAVAAAAIGAANWADVASTQDLVAAGGREAWNPGLYGPRAERIVPMKLAVIAAETGVFYALRRRSRAAAWTWAAVVVVGNVLITRRNAEITDRLQAPAPQLQVSWSW